MANLDADKIPQGSFWGTFGATLVPWYNAYGSYVTDPTVAATNQGNPGNPAGLAVPAFNSSFAFFLVFMGKFFNLWVFCSGRIKNFERLTNELHRIGVPYLPHLLAPHQCRLLHNISYIGLRIWLSCRSIFKPGIVLREQHEPRCLGHCIQTGGGTLLVSCESDMRVETDRDV